MQKNVICYLVIWKYTVSNIVTGLKSWHPAPNRSYLFDFRLVGLLVGWLVVSAQHSLIMFWGNNVELPPPVHLKIQFEDLCFWERGRSSKHSNYFTKTIRNARWIKTNTYFKESEKRWGRNETLQLQCRKPLPEEHWGLPALGGSHLSIMGEGWECRAWARHRQRASGVGQKPAELVSVQKTAVTNLGICTVSKRQFSPSRDTWNSKGAQGRRLKD